ncbi:MAG: hypothetical protein ISS28_08690 [Candidatus Cloacimonetes bacterium]|nr:hypothetical protein [Candidatus Cloacimonadota bacterium]
MTLVTVRADYEDLLKTKFGTKIDNKTRKDILQRLIVVLNQLVDDGCTDLFNRYIYPTGSSFDKDTQEMSQNIFLFLGNAYREIGRTDSAIVIFQLGLENLSDNENITAHLKYVKKEDWNTPTPSIPKPTPPEEIPPLPPAKERVVFIPYDKSPEPLGGYVAIERNIVYPEIAQKSEIEGTVIV